MNNENNRITWCNHSLADSLNLWHSRWWREVMHTYIKLYSYFILKNSIYEEKSIRPLKNIMAGVGVRTNFTDSYSDSDSRLDHTFDSDSYSDSSLYLTFDSGSDSDSTKKESNSDSDSTTPTLTPQPWFSQTCILNFVPYYVLF